MYSGNNMHACTSTVLAMDYIIHGSSVLICIKPIKGAKSATADSCIDLAGPRQCRDLRHQSHNYDNRSV